MSHWTYLFINLAAIAIPFIFSFHPRLRFDQTWRAFLIACLITAAFFIAWDILFTYWGVWGFTPKYLLGINMFYLPLEEYLFFFCIPYACVFTYHCLKILVEKDYLGRYSKIFSFFLAILLLLLAGLNLDKCYTSTTFILTGIFLLFHVFIFKVNWLGYFYLSYILTLPGFFSVNGLLTGSLIEEQVVWYNNAENLGIQMGTIPIEDSIYGLFLLLMNVSIYEYYLSTVRDNLKYNERTR